MMNLSLLTKQVKDWLKADSNFDGFYIDRSVVVNEDAGRAVNGWIGIYRKGADYAPGQLGVGPDNYDAEIELMILVQRSAMESGAACEDLLEADVQNLLSRMVLLPKTYVDHFSGILVDYTYNESDSKTLFFQGALITFSAEASS